MEEYRISKLRLYLFTIIDTLTNSSNSQINADMLSNDINNYSLDKIPTASTIERWITGDEIHRDVYSFRSRLAYSQDTINNLDNIGFYEKFEKIIKSNNEAQILPDIEGIESIECLNCGTLINTTTNSAEFDIQIQITYREI
ncbi:MAG: hypothetical protein K6E94_03860 [Elusimicrobiaceae bacterium]|nr:hypothetical protein [Elusimicrobiaceae bacterium]